MNLERVENIVALISEFPISEIEVTQEGQRVFARRPLTDPQSISAVPQLLSPMTGTALALAETDQVAKAETGVAVELRTLTALMVGIFYHAAPPLPYAASVRPGQVVGYIESMKLMNDVVAEEGGHIVEVLVEDGAPVEYGQALFRLAA